MFAFCLDDVGEIGGIDISTQPVTLMKKFLRRCRSISLTVTDSAADIHSAADEGGNCLLFIIISREVILHV